MIGVLGVDRIGELHNWHWSSRDQLFTWVVMVTLLYSCEEDDCDDEED